MKDEFPFTKNYFVYDTDCNSKNEKRREDCKVFLSSLLINFQSESEEKKSLINAMKKGRKTSLLKSEEKKDFLKKLKSAK